MKYFHKIILNLLFASTIASTDMPPAITKDPADASVSLGTTASFAVSASGAAPLTYQWHFESMSLPGATNRVLTLTNVLLPQAGHYTVVLTNASGSITSRVATLDIETTFRKINLPALNLAGGVSGVSWADYNEDGFQDLLIVGKGGGNTTLFLNQGGATFVKVAGAVGIGGAGLGGGSWADFDNDGHLDLFIGGANTLYHNNGNGTFSKTPFNAGINSYCVSWADFDNDGFVDLFMGNYYTGGQNAFFRNNGDGTFSKITDSILARDKGNSQGVTWGDYDNDGLPDLFVANTGGQKCFLYHNEGHGNFTKITNSPVTMTSGNFACGAWGDYDDDGFLDLFVCGYNQKHLLFHNNGNGTFTSVQNAGSIITDAGDDQTAAWADYDNDGYLDLFVCGGGPTHGLKDFLYHNNGDGTFTKITRGSLGNDNGEGGGAAWADFDRNGFPDLFISNFQNLATGDKENYLYLNTGNSNNWLSVKCEGRISNRAAIGAKIRVKAVIQGKELWQLREISGGGNYISQNSLEASFGLGDATNAALIRIEWPSGIIQELKNVPAKQFLTVREPSKVSAKYLPTSGGIQLAVTPAAGLNYSFEASTNLTDWIPITSLTNQPVSGNSARFFRGKEL